LGINHKWFDFLAGQDPKGLRDVLIHHEAITQIAGVRPDIDAPFVHRAALKTGKGFVAKDLYDVLREMTIGWCVFLDEGMASFRYEARSRRHSDYSVSQRRCEDALSPLSGGRVTKFLGIPNGRSLRGQIRRWSCGARMLMRRPLYDHCQECRHWRRWQYGAGFAINRWCRHRMRPLKLQKKDLRFTEVRISVFLYFCDSHCFP
jgi:hypothetical protein